MTPEDRQSLIDFLSGLRQHSDASSEQLEDLVNKVKAKNISHKDLLAELKNLEAAMQELVGIISHVLTGLISQRDCTSTDTTGRVAEPPADFWTKPKDG